ncbi:MULTISPECIES: CorA metal ion transporter family protein [Staphylococcus]|uniref:CorA metal ion transporter family protein n=1 Tax=Staphylococcus TaxID=1279 RepID=UPI0008A14F58|nr:MULTISPECIES: CorA metal ion transporter family protein [Staphylococcus]ARB76890.1 magnesium transporter CorA [Staphylococcus lugdunensis]ARJ17935.1 magnesium transporter CorA [Staphylococcus lugdunensis]MBM7134778.1 CorA metal ion transporter family protein [Staphylococcus lugdunensis]MCC2083367.1 CorA metal ion transporter family protein [Staphylococcus lugdunensis]MCH8643086.1 CorA metal ion transporter family protein [Staphylococcus lugdunensis]
MTITIHYKNDQQQCVSTTNWENVPSAASLKWMDVVNPTAEEKKLITERFALIERHIEESVYLMSRPKFILNEQQQSTYVLLHAIDDHNFSAHPMSIHVNKQWMITIHRTELDAISQLQNAWQHQQLDITSTDDLALQLIDIITKNYFRFIDEVEDRVFSFENQNVDRTNNKKLMDDVYDIRSEIIKLKRVLIPMEQLLAQVVDEDMYTIAQQQRWLFKHIHSRLQHQRDTLISCEQITDDIKDNNESYRSNRINRVMNVLTIISSIFFPLSFLTGWYGMNFKYMPELNWHYSYFAFIGISLIVTITLILFFKKKDWL